MAALAMGAHMRQKGADAMEHAHDVNVEHPPPIFEGNLIDAAGSADSGVIADDMDVPEGFIGCRRGGFNTEMIRNVTDRSADIGPNIAQALHGFCQGVCLDVGEHHFHTRSGKSSGKGEPNAARSARHEGRLIGEFLHEFPPLPVIARTEIASGARRGSLVP